MTVFGFSISRAAHSFGWTLAIAGIVLAVALLAVISHVGGPKAVSPIIQTETKVTQVVPAIGEQGYNVEALCNDPLSVASKDLVAPPDSTYVATYHLERVKDGIHETVTVGIYADPDRQPTATHYDSANVPTDAFVSKPALECIQKKAAK